MIHNDLYFFELYPLNNGFWQLNAMSRDFVLTVVSDKFVLAELNPPAEARLVRAARAVASTVSHLLRSTTLMTWKLSETPGIEGHDINVVFIYADGAYQIVLNGGAVKAAVVPYAPNGRVHLPLPSPDMFKASRDKRGPVGQGTDAAECKRIADAIKTFHELGLSTLTRSEQYRVMFRAALSTTQVSP